VLPIVSPAERCPACRARKFHAQLQEARAREEWQARRIAELEDGTSTGRLVRRHEAELRRLREEHAAEVRRLREELVAAAAAASAHVAPVDHTPRPPAAPQSLPGTPEAPRSPWAVLFEEGAEQADAAAAPCTAAADQTHAQLAARAQEVDALRDANSKMVAALEMALSSREQRGSDERSEGAQLAAPRELRRVRRELDAANRRARAMGAQLAAAQLCLDIRQREGAAAGTRQAGAAVPRGPCAGAGGPGPASPGSWAGGAGLGGDARQQDRGAAGLTAKWLQVELASIGGLPPLGPSSAPCAASPRAAPASWGPGSSYATPAELSPAARPPLGPSHEEWTSTHDSASSGGSSASSGAPPAARREPPVPRLDLSAVQPRRGAPPASPRLRSAPSSSSRLDASLQRLAAAVHTMLSMRASD
jgi:hypothetical protein